MQELEKNDLCVPSATDDGTHTQTNINACSDRSVDRPYNNAAHVRTADAGEDAFYPEHFDDGDGKKTSATFTDCQGQSLFVGVEGIPYVGHTDGGEGCNVTKIMTEELNKSLSDFCRKIEKSLRAETEETEDE